MANLYKNKVVCNGQTLIDLTADTVAADKLLAGYTAHGKDGEPITGTLTAGNPVYCGTITLTVTSYTLTLTGFDFTPNRLMIVASERVYSSTSSAKKIVSIIDTGISKILTQTALTASAGTLVTSSFTISYANGSVNIPSNGYRFEKVNYDFVVWRE